MNLLYSAATGLFCIRCDCGFSTPFYATVEAAGRAADLHMAQRWPIGTKRRPCTVNEFILVSQWQSPPSLDPANQINQPAPRLKTYECVAMGTPLNLGEDTEHRDPEHSG
jgi:hypothetical protein